ncbi:hypothetical protein Gotri_015130 [Gossypium trilobum]|uniref:Uncharacterized protein n=1 Tax=Gossypium trilobum TaxID=34281 RepID=A0A7J9DZ56_9ROSI|nr:hypothetical protein [Gossypium trilobum]
MVFGDEFGRKRGNEAFKGGGEVFRRKGLRQWREREEVFGGQENDSFGGKKGEFVKEEMEALNLYGRMPVLPSSNKILIMEDSIVSLSLEDAEDETIQLGVEASDSETSYANCFVGTLLTLSVVHFQAMGSTLANV